MRLLTVVLTLIACITFITAHSALADEGGILFHDRVDKSFSIFKARTDGSGLREIIKGGTYPLWSPDRKRIAFIALLPGTEEPEHTGGLRIADFFGKELLKIEGVKSDFKEKELSKVVVCDYEWSHNGRQLAFASILMKKLYLQIFDFQTKRTKNIYQKEVKDTGWAYLNTQIIWSFDDKEIFFTSEDGGIEVINLDKGAINIIIPHGIPSSMSAGEDKIIFAFLRGKVTSFWSIDKKGSKGDEFELEGKLSPVSGSFKNHILIKETSVGQKSNIFLFDLKSRKKEKIQVKDLTVISGGLSPKGDKVFIAAIETKNNEIKGDEPEDGYYILDLKTKKLTLLKKITQRDSDYLSILYLGKRKGFSWR